MRYGAAWQAVMQLVRKGSSWSGYERNCAFLNMGGKFVASSHVSGLDFVDDGRGVAVSDWDQDGDLDLWFRNRTAPRIRIMLNSSSSGRPGRVVAFRLEGTKAIAMRLGPSWSWKSPDMISDSYARCGRETCFYLSQVSGCILDCRKMRL